MASSSSSSRGSLALAVRPSVKRPRIDQSDLRGLIAHANQTKASLADTLTLLKEQGLLKEGVTKRELKRASEHHAKQDTPYGRVVIQVELNAASLQYLDVVNPAAILHYLTMISEPFAKMMYECCTPGCPLRLVIYADEMNPGNPFRPEKSRTLQCIYWAFADWPAHVLSRTFAWLVLCTIRSKVIEEIDGGMSYICRMVLRIFFQRKAIPWHAV